MQSCEKRDRLADFSRRDECFRIRRFPRVTSGRIGNKPGRACIDDDWCRLSSSYSSRGLARKLLSPPPLSSPLLFQLFPSFECVLSLSLSLSLSLLFTFHHVNFFEVSLQGVLFFFIRFPRWNNFASNDNI